jgi:hypothetical protein
VQGEEYKLEVEEQPTQGRWKTQFLHYERKWSSSLKNWNMIIHLKSLRTTSTLYSLHQGRVSLFNSPYGGGERDVRRFSGAAGTIELEDFKREFTMWCELYKSCNTNFNPYMVWRALFGCLE